MTQGFEIPKLSYCSIGTFRYQDFVADLLGEQYKQLAVETYKDFILPELCDSLHLEGMTKQEIFVIQTRYRGMTLQAIAETVGRTRSRIREIQHKALRKLRWKTRLPAFKQAVMIEAERVLCVWIDTDEVRWSNEYHTAYVKACRDCGRKLNEDVTTDFCPIKPGY